MAEVLAPCLRIKSFSETLRLCVVESLSLNTLVVTALVDRKDDVVELRGDVDLCARNLRGVVVIHVLVLKVLLDWHSLSGAKAHRGGRD